MIQRCVANIISCKTEGYFGFYLTSSTKLYGFQGPLETRPYCYDLQSSMAAGD